MLANFQNSFTNSFCKTGNDIIYDVIIWVQDGNCKKWLERILVLVHSILWGHVEEILLLNNFFSDCRYMPYLRRYSPTKLCNGAQRAIFGDFLRPVFAASRVQHISDLHSTFALRPHLAPKYGKHPISDR